MNDFFFGPTAAFMWFVASAIFLFCASYVWQIVREVGGVRGTALAIIFTACTVICSCFGLIISDQEWISNFVLGAIVSAAWPPIVVCSLVLTDLYAASRNNHRSFTARSYLAYKRYVGDEPEGHDADHFVMVDKG